jgi:hypothetical protein
MPAPIAGVVRAAYGDATGHIFMISAAFAVVALAAVLLVKEVPLRSTVSIADPEAAERGRVAEVAAPQAVVSVAS